MITFISDPIYTAHNTGPGHPEQSDRTKVIAMALDSAKIKTAENTLKPKRAAKEDILLCHTSPYFELVQKEVNALDPIEVATFSTGDVQISSDSFDAALYAAGGVLTAVDEVMVKPQMPVYCIVRPPGHHACPSRGMGFCLFNNVAIGARYAQKKYGIKRILIADWDVHHGNGTQDIFYNDPSVFYFSTHEKDIYPFTGFTKETGSGQGIGFTLNCPIVPSINARKEVIRAFDESLRKQMESFQPELIMISCGFDAHQSDPLGHFNLTDDDFFTLTRIVKEIADTYAKGRCISVLEGGYNLDALASASIAHVRALAK